MAIDKMIGSQALISSDYSSSHTQQVQRSRDIAINNSIKSLNQTASKISNDDNVSREMIEEVVDKTNEFLAPVRRDLKFELHDKLNKYYVSVVDANTKEVIKEIPPKKFLDMYAAMAEFMGLLVDRKI